MSTTRQIQSARANGARSKGPVTPKGKLASSRNAVTHGLLASTVAIDGESKDGFEQHLAAFVGEFRPSTSSEIALVECMATARWRQMRIWALQKVAVDLEIASLAAADTAPDTMDPASTDSQPRPQAEGTLAAVRATLAMRTLTDDSRCMEILHRYETTYERQFLRALSTIRRNRREDSVQTSAKIPASYIAGASICTTFFDPPATADLIETRKSPNEPVFGNETEQNSRQPAVNNG